MITALQKGLRYSFRLDNLLMGEGVIVWLGAAVAGCFAWIRKCYDREVFCID
ncbi:MAG: hypothetical protein J5821_03120 [Alphaproteobacteria bacterium]|nr:hypothetical protein [Alphaproteobacteria bacterium]